MFNSSQSTPKKSISREMKKKTNRNNFPSQKPFFFIIIIGIIIAGAFSMISLSRDRSFLRSTFSTGAAHTTRPNIADDSVLTGTILHYATSRIVPQQNHAEIKITFDVLSSLSPCNFLVFGLGHDSLMWSSFNAKGATLFLEEDPKWVYFILKDAPPNLKLSARAVQYTTHLSEADELLSSYKSNPACSPTNLQLREYSRSCKLALADLPDEVYDKEWDLIMIDAPRGYFPEAPGRMSAIFSAAVMARCE